MTRCRAPRPLKMGAQCAAVVQRRRLQPFHAAARDDSGAARAPPPRTTEGALAATTGDPQLPLVTQLEGGDKADTFVTSAGVVQDVEEEDARVRGAGGRQGGAKEGR
jgi:hypothetical protein